MTTSTSPHFPSHTNPRNWLITSAASPIGLALARAVLAHGDSVILGVELSDLERGYGKQRERAEEFDRFMKEEVEQEGWKERSRVVGLDGRIIGQCQAAVAEAVESVGKIDILFCCASEAIIGTVEELATSHQTLTLVRSQFETNFFGPVNIIKATLPTMRQKRSGHIIILTGITSHIGTPGLGIYCASGWALEGFCDSLAYEIAPFNIKTTILQPNLETNILTNRLTSAPLLPAYSPTTHPAPLARTILGSLLDRISYSPQEPDPSNPQPQESPPSPHSPFPTYPLKQENSTTPPPPPSTPPPTLLTPHIESLTPTLPPSMTAALIAETIQALCAIGGHDNPPGRHIVGYEAVSSVKEKLKTISEELEDFVEVSAAVDIEEGTGAGSGGGGGGGGGRGEEEKEDGG